MSSEPAARSPRPPARKSRNRGRRAVAARGEGTRLRDEIIEASLALLEELDDPWQLSLRAVARKVGIATTSIYLHFESLESLLVAVKATLWERFGERMGAAATSVGTTPRDRVIGLGRAYLALAEEHPAAFRMLFSTPWHLDRNFSDEGQFALLTDAVGDVASSPEDALLRAVQLWCGIHGLVVLRQTMTRFPWPEVDAQLESLAQAWSTPAE